MEKVYCKYCGGVFNSVRSLTNLSCPCHPNGANKGRHALYEGDEADEYVCKYCGKTASSIRTLISSSCPRHPNGHNKGKHSPAL